MSNSSTMLVGSLNQHIGSHHSSFFDWLSSLMQYNNVDFLERATMIYWGLWH